MLSGEKTTTKTLEIEIKGVCSAGMKNFEMSVASTVPRTR